MNPMMKPAVTLLLLALLPGCVAADKTPSFPVSWSLAAEAPEAGYTSAIVSDCPGESTECVLLTNVAGAPGVRWPRGEYGLRLAAGPFRAK